MGNQQHHFLAFDLGASSGRAILGTLNERRLTLTEVHRFRNRMTCIHGSYYWNIYNLFEELKTGLARCVGEFGIKPLSIGIDTWGVDYALVKTDGRLTGLPYAYRDHRTDNAMTQFFKLMPEKDVYDLTGIQFMQFNSLFQLFSSVRQNDSDLSQADSMLFTPDVLNYFFTGVKKNEYTIASTSQLLKPGKAEWEQRLFEVAGIPVGLQSEIVLPGTILADVLPEIDEQTGCGIIPCVAVASHDTASAVVSVPAEGDNWAFLSSGTWSLLGIETPVPVISEKSLQMNFTNEGGAEMKTRFLKNIMGMWLLQECKRIWDREEEIGWGSIVEMAEGAQPFKCLINPDAHGFLNPVNMPEAIRNYCLNTNQPVPENKGEIARCVYDSLAMKYRMTLEQIEEVSQQKIERLHIIGGGSSNRMLNQLTANITGKQVIAGPSEATAIGNIMIQALALGFTGSVKEIREIVRNSFDVQCFLPESPEGAETAYKRFLHLI